MDNNRSFGRKSSRSLALGLAAERPMDSPNGHEVVLELVDGAKIILNRVVFRTASIANLAGANSGRSIEERRPNRVNNDRIRGAGPLRAFLPSCI